MRAIRGLVLAAGSTVGSGGCATLPMTMQGAYRPACTPMQARAYRTTSIFQTRQRVAQIQAKYSIARISNVGAAGWRAASSGECR